MAKLRVFSVYDSKVQAYTSPFYARTVAEAQRSWIAVVNDGESMMSKHPADYALFQIGTFDEETGTIEPLEAKASISTALEAKRPEQEAPRSLNAV